MIAGRPLLHLELQLPQFRVVRQITPQEHQVALRLRDSTELQQPVRPRAAQNRRQAVGLFEAPGKFDRFAPFPAFRRNQHALLENLPGAREFFLRARGLPVLGKLRAPQLIEVRLLARIPRELE